MKSNIISTRVEDELLSAINENSARLNMDRAAYIREAIYEKINGGGNTMIPRGDELARCIGKLSYLIYNNYISYNTREIINVLNDINNNLIMVYNEMNNSNRGRW